MLYIEKYSVKEEYRIEVVDGPYKGTVGVMVHRYHKYIDKDDNLALPDNYVIEILDPISCERINCYTGDCILSNNDNITKIIYNSEYLYIRDCYNQKCKVGDIVIFNYYEKMNVVKITSITKSLTFIYEDAIFAVKKITPQHFKSNTEFVKITPELYRNIFNSFIY